ncbi:MAG: chitobiase/beta-hexosaminidase C-terminal domain-containing protein [Fibrobacteres bacterium]|nr:chitobiase/beta-hexosaminidase C-terminal domain-containing protein [Fibrobacterota bacterium]
MVLLTIAAALASSLAQAQTKRCDLVGRDTTVSGNPASFKRCLDLSSLDGKTVNVPLNVTRIDNDGLSLCKGAVQAGGDADIVYVYDNSGSMRAGSAYINSGTGDTTYYYDVCGTSAGDSISFYQWNDNGTSQVLRKIPHLSANGGCSNISGDPYNARARAFYLGIQDQAARAPQSTAGIMGFENGTEPVVRPRVLNSTANITAVQGGINTAFTGGTNYNPPLDSARKWLTTSTITSNPKKAIIFLSDGRPSDSPNFGSGTPPIYGIFLGRPRSDTAVLSNMSLSTGGKFFIIPPDDPDSLKSVVASILNIVLLQYSPQSASVTNSSIAPAQTATSAAADFIPQPDGSWLMKLSDIIGLNANGSNVISVSTSFKEKTSGNVDTKTISFTVSTTLPASSTTQKIGTTQFGMTCYDRSSLLILDAGNARPAYFTDSNTIYQVRIRTSPSPLDSAVAAATTRAQADTEAPHLKPPIISNADSLVFRNAFPFQGTGAARVLRNGTLESSAFDSIIVAWSHPRDPQDFVADTMRVRPKGQASQVWFAQSNGGAAVTQFPASTSVVYIVVKDQAPDAHKSYTAIVTSETFSIDKETVVLTPLTPGSGTLVGQLTVANDTKTQGNGKLEVSVGGDQLRVVYKDPVDIGDSAQATAGFDQSVEEAPALRFTDASGNPLPAGTIWSPANGKLYFDYSDDAVNGTLATEQIFLTLASKKYGVQLAADHERIAADYVAKLTDTRGHWKGSIDLADAMPTDSNGKAETRFRGEATISANAHDNKGASQNLTVTDFLVIAYPDSQASIQWKMDTTVTSNEGMIFTVRDQSFTKDNDTVLVNVACVKSGDSVANFPAGEGPTPLSGQYTTGTLPKDEGTPNLGDRILSCLTTDQIRVRYTDPVYGGITEIIIEEVAKPVATPAGNKFVTSESVELTSETPGAVIWYTLDGSKPVPGQSLLYSDPIRIGVTTTLKAIAVKPGFKDSKILTTVYTKETVASRLEILDENGNAIPGNVLTGASKAITIKLITTQDNLTSADVPTVTRAAGDSETALLRFNGSLGNAIELSSKLPLLSPATRSLRNDTLDAAGNDTIVVRWVNPYNPADVAADTLVIKPAFVAAEVYFSATENGPKITQYPVNTDTVYIVVKTRPRDPSLTYNVVLTSSDGSSDTEVIVLTELSPGVFSGKAPVGTGAKAKGDHVIQVAAAGDQLTAVFTDPVYHDPYRGDAGFAQQVQESAQLDFIDENGDAVAPGAVWSPAKGKVFVRYSDDWNAGIDSLVHSKTVRFSLVNWKSGDSVGADNETLVISLKSHTVSRGTWEGSITLADSSKAKAGDNILETYYLGKLRAAVTPHDNAGADLNGEVTDTLAIAYPDQPAEIIVRDTSGGTVQRKTDQVEIVIHDQLVTKSGEATITATVSCSQSGDQVQNVVLVWNGTEYVAKPPVEKGELNSGTPNKSDAILQCRQNDIFVVNYTDPVFGTPRSTEVRWIDDTPPEMWYASVKDGSRIASVTDGSANSFVIVVKGVSPTRDKVDTISVTLSIGADESEIFKAVETGPFTGEFRTTATFRFQTGSPQPGDGTIEARLDPKARINQAVVNGKATISGSDVKADLTLLSIFDLAVSAWAADVDGDGRADHLYFRFDHSLARLPDGLTAAYWNAVSPDLKQKAEASQLSFAKGDSSLIIADFSKSQFGLGLTGIPDGKPAPYALFPDDNLFGGQQALLADSVGPIPLTAMKLPSNGQTYAVTQTERRFTPDTLVITVSEKLRTSTSFSAVFRFSKGCRDYSESVPLLLFSLPETSPDGITYKAIVDNALETQTPLVGDCIFLETDGRFSDLAGNLPSKVGAPITGADPKLVIRAFKGYPPVAGIDAGSVGFTTANQDKLSDGTYRQETGIDQTVQVIWVPPVGFDVSNPIGSLENVARDFGNSQTGNRAGESAHPQPMPPGISTVQVITSAAYLAHITIFDNLGNFVRTMNQSFGHNGELRNGSRTVEGGQVSFLVWDMKDSHGSMVGQGVYVWKVNFTFEDTNRKSEVRFTRTGVLRQN